MTEKQAHAETAGDEPDTKAQSDKQERERRAQAVADDARGYRQRTLYGGQIDYVALHDHWTNPDENEVKEHVAAYRSKLANFTV